MSKRTDSHRDTRFPSPSMVQVVGLPLLLMATIRTCNITVWHFEGFLLTVVHFISFSAYSSFYSIYFQSFKNVSQKVKDSCGVFVCVLLPSSATESYPSEDEDPKSPKIRPLEICFERGTDWTADWQRHGGYHENRVNERAVLLHNMLSCPLLYWQAHLVV